jgi:hypothetical protein
MKAPSKQNHGGGMFLVWALLTFCLGGTPVRGQDRPVSSPSPLDRLAAAEIPVQDRLPNQPKELVAILGNRARAAGVAAGLSGIQPARPGAD